MRVQITFSLITLFILAAGLGAGCGKKASDMAAEKVMEQAMKAGGNESADVDIDSKTGDMSIKTKDGDNDVNIQVKGDSTTITSKDGETVSTYSSNGETFTSTSGDGSAVTVGKGAKVPEGFPKDISVYPGAEIQVSSGDPANKAYAVQALSTDAIDKIGAFYKKGMKDQGWTEVQAMSQTGETAMEMLSYEKGEATAVIVITAQDDKTSVSITTGMQ